MQHLVVLCDGRRIDELVEGLTCQWEGEAKREVLWCGLTHRYGLGVIVLACEQEAEEFLHDLQEQSDLFDVCESPEDATCWVARAQGTEQEKDS
jgi:hypothetical protein